MTASRRAVPGVTLREQAAYVAGVLAENGQRELRWRSPGGAERPLARGTDVPGLLISEAGVLVCAALDLAVERVEGGLAWSSGDEKCAQLFAGC